VRLRLRKVAAYKCRLKIYGKGKHFRGTTGQPSLAALKFPPLKIRGVRGVMKIMKITPFNPPYSKGEI